MTRPRKPSISRREWAAMQPTREQWLQERVADLTERVFPSWYREGFPVVRVSCGWSGSAPNGYVACVKGECWDKEASAAGVHEIFISPMLDDPLDVLGVLVHELCHAVCGGSKEGHGENFARLAAQCGLNGPWESTTPTVFLTGVLKQILSEVDAYPHARLAPPPPPPDMPPPPGPGQAPSITVETNYECGACGYAVGVPVRWATRGMPRCACGAEAWKDAKP